MTLEIGGRQNHWRRAAVIWEGSPLSILKLPRVMMELIEKQRARRKSLSDEGK